ncbi:MHYT domain-containing protein [Sinimarinibacterium flocculans]|uniref:NO-binding membrane sensor protein with MHYT domain n=1 Tax=Sinimarinibacterium flocculans TaxID=985250 RepID=A0A318E7M2_9GAMM|nr:MHYT domain-containing protein [Sinimarinibacterium flocculans]PXV64656.1 NO-binding membrane sensor protein with MHYT domain [Sinimarinibacterium flocculans]
MTPAYLVGQFDPALVLLSYLVAVLAAYTAIDLVHRISQNRAREKLWLALGALAMGIGIWGMHFIGMQSFTLPIALGFDPAKTVVSLLAAIAAAGFALWTSSRERMDRRAAVVGTVLVGAGICAMHYVGMFAMEMRPGIDWHAGLVVASVAVAVAASGATLWVLFRLRGIARRHQLLARFGAALAIGLAVVAMHYTGMAAARFPVGGSSGALGSLTGLWVVWPLAGFAAALALMVMALAAYDIRAQARAAEALRQRALDERARMLALYDERTMMRNRASFQQEIVGLIQNCSRSDGQFDLFYGRLRFPALQDDESVHEAMRVIAERLQPLTRSTDLLARYSKTEFTLLRPRLHQADIPRALRDQLMAACNLPLQVGDQVVQAQAHVGTGNFPADGRHSRLLLQAAARSDVNATQLLPAVLITREEVAA